MTEENSESFEKGKMIYDETKKRFEKYRNLPNAVYNESLHACLTDPNIKDADECLEGVKDQHNEDNERSLRELRKVKVLFGTRRI